MKKHEEIWDKMSFYEKVEYQKRQKEIFEIDKIRNEYVESTDAERRKLPPLVGVYR